MFSSGFRASRRVVARSRRGRAWRVERIETLEGRALMASSPTDYVLTGLQWTNPNHVTYSIAPDGVQWDHGINNLNAVFNARFGGAWQREIARALATWESVANINIGQVSDGPYNLDTLGLSQSDPRFGDIRFGGYAFANDTTTLAQTYYPPPNGSTSAGDVEVNTSMSYNVGSDFDVFSVLLHETGHALGLAHPTSTDVVMSARYHGVLTGLAEGDIAGIQAIYGPRTDDVYQAQGLGVRQDAPINVTPMLNATGGAILPNVSLATIGDTEYFSIVAPAGASGVLQVVAASHTLSLLSPKVSLYDSSGNLLDSEANPSAWGDNVTVHASGIVAGQRYLVAVTGATSDVFAVGAYQLHVGFSMTPTPTPTPGPNPNPSPAPAPAPSSPIVAIAPDRFEPNNTASQAGRLGSVSQSLNMGLSLNASTDVDFFQFQNARTSTYLIAARWCKVQVLDRSGRIVASGVDQVQIPSMKLGTTLYVRISAATTGVVPDYALAISSVSAASLGIGSGRAASAATAIPTAQGPATTLWSRPWSGAWVAWPGTPAKRSGGR